MSEAPVAPRSRRKSYVWQYRQDEPAAARAISDALKIHPAVARVLASRGFSQPGAALDEFLRPTLGATLDPFGLRDMEAAVERTMRAIRNREKITIYGDYDTDGTTSTALLVRTFGFLEYPVEYYIPHRMEEGYGLNRTAIDQIARTGTNLVITVDNGITALEQVAHAGQLGMDVVVTDHHQPCEGLPPAVAVVNPSRPDCTYLNKGLTGVGVAFKFAHALLKRMDVAAERALPFLRSVMDLVAVGTLADIAPLIGENRTLVKFGLQQIARTGNVGIAALISMLEMAPGSVDAHKVCFQIAPRLNAAGRTDSAAVCVELLTTSDAERASEIAQQLELSNRERRSVESRILAQCLEYIETTLDPEAERVLVVAGQDWHVGVIGIVASRLVELFDRPSIVISLAGEAGKGSARSIKNFNLHEALQACCNSLLGFGGHRLAAGLQIESSRLNEFRDAMNTFASGKLTEEDLQPSLTIDAELNPQDVNLALLRDLTLLSPHGPMNPKPVFSLRGMRLAERPRVVGTDHLKLHLAADGKRFGCIGFRMGQLASELAELSGKTLVDVAFAPTLNDYFGEPQVELDLKDVKISPRN